MKLFRWFRSKPEPDGEWWEKVAQLEQRQKSLELEWEDTFEKIRGALAKLGKRAKALEAAEPNGTEPLGSPEGRPIGRMSPSEYGQRLAAARARWGRSG